MERTFYTPALASWVVWIVFIAFTFCLIKRKNVKQIFCNILYSAASFATIIIFAVSLSFSGPKLQKPEKFIAIDIHSHTIVSHDNVGTMNESLEAHLKAGFDVFFNTEHNHTLGLLNFPKNDLCKIVYPGMQIATRTNGSSISVLLLSAKEFNGKDFENLYLPELIQKAHENKMLVIMPHWWKWRLNSLENLKNFGIDGFEIYNCGYRNISMKERASIIDFCKTNNLMMFGVTDWHGWGFMTDVWTVFEGSINQNIVEQLDKKPDIRVLLHRRDQSHSWIRFVFEPFSAFYYYLKSTSIKYIVSFMIWGLVLFFFFINFFKKIKSNVALVLAVLFANYALYFYTIARHYSSTNSIVFRDVIPTLLGFCVIWTVLWRLQKNEK
jgi:hypothetical protein